MSCTVVAIPYALGWVIGSVIVGTTMSLNAMELKSKNTQEIDDNISVQDITYQIPCEDTTVISADHFLEKDLETAFKDKNILLKTLEEHGVSNIHVDMLDNISGLIDNYTLQFIKSDEEKPYTLRITYKDSDNAESKLEDLSSEYALNVQEDVYLSIVDKLKENCMQIEDEEVLEDNTIVLTVNID